MRAGLFLAGILFSLGAVVGPPSAVHAEGEDETPQATPAPKPKPAKKQETSEPRTGTAGSLRGERGLASWYRTKRAFAAAHRTFPLGTKVKVSTDKGQSVIVTIVGRGPFRKERVIDLSSDAFKKLASLGTGILKVTLQRVQQ